MAELRPAATVVVVREHECGIETLMLRRSPHADFMAGHWVFPGGGVDQADLDQADGDLELASRLAAVRELEEEAGLSLSPEQLVPLSRWTAPEEAPKRYDTLFFLARAPGTPVQVDGQEIDQFQWFAPGSVLGAQRAGQMQLMPPTFITLEWLSRYDRLEFALQSLASSLLPHFRPRMGWLKEGAVFFYEGDAGYDDGDTRAPGPRHRFWMIPGNWHYERAL